MSGIAQRQQIIAIVDEVRASSGLLDKAAAMAECFSAQWTAVHVSVVGNEADPEIVGAAFERAIASGADVIEIPGDDKFDALFGLISERRPTPSSPKLRSHRRVVALDGTGKIVCWRLTCRQISCWSNRT